MSINKINMSIPKATIKDRKLDELKQDATKGSDSEPAESLDINTDTLNKIADFAESKPTDFLNRLSYEDLQKALADLSPQELIALFKKLSPEEQKQLLASLSPENSKGLLNQLDPATLKNLLASLSPENLKGLLNLLDPATLKNLLAAIGQKGLDQLSPAELKKLLENLSPAELKQIQANLNSENIKTLITLDHAQLLTALGQLKHQDLLALLGHMPPSMLRDAFNRLDEQQFFDILTSSKELFEPFAEQCDLTQEQLHQLMDEVKSTCTPEQQEVLDGLLTCQTEDEALDFADEHAGVFLGAPGADAATDPYDTPPSFNLKSAFQPSNSVFGSFDFNKGKIDITKLMIFLFMDFYETRSDMLRRNGLTLTAIKNDTKELGTWWDAVRDAKGLDPKSKEDYQDIPADDNKKQEKVEWTPQVDMDQVFKNYDKLPDGNKVKDAYKSIMEKIKSTADFSDFLKKDSTTGQIVEPRKFDFTNGKTPAQLMDKVNSYLADLGKRLETQAISLFDKDKDNKYQAPSGWGDKVKDFQSRASEANTVQQNTATIINAETTTLQSLNNMQTKIMETRQAILQKITSM